MFLCLFYVLEYIQKQPSGGVLKKRCSENMQQFYRRIHCIFSEHLFLKTSLENCFSAYLLCIFARIPFERISWHKNIEDSEFCIIMKSATSLAEAHLEFLSWGKDTLRHVLITFIKLIYNMFYICITGPMQIYGLII